MVRKMLVVAAAIAMPMSAVAVVGATGGVAGAVVGPPDPAVTCTISATVTFAPPGISSNGQVGTGVKSTQTTVSSETLGGAGCVGSSSINPITAKTVKCVKGQPGQPSTNPGCNGVKGTEGWDSWGDFASTGTATILKSTKKLNFTINGIPYQTKNTSAAAIGCPGGEVGFQISGTIKAPKNDKGQTDVLTACLGTVTGTSLQGSTPFMFQNQVFAPEPTTVATAQIDPVTSSVAIS
jgi:hypothetical protein